MLNSRSRLRLLLAPVLPLPPRMSAKEVNCYRSALKSCNTLIEYGCGGSTILALKMGLRCIVSVETDPQWIADMQRKPLIMLAQARRRLRFVHADIGPVGDWGFPMETRPEQFASYPSAPWGQGFRADIVLIDGRFRVAAALESLIRGANCIAVHDFWDRPHYHAILPFVDCVDKADTLALLWPKSTFDREAAARVRDAYFQDPR